MVALHIPTADTLQLLSASLWIKRRFLYSCFWPGQLHTQPFTTRLKKGTPRIVHNEDYPRTEIIGSLVFERRTATGNETFSLFTRLSATTFVILSVVTRIETIYLKIRAHLLLKGVTRLSNILPLSVSVFIKSKNNINELSLH